MLGNLGRANFGAKGMPRRLVAILAADVVGYSRLMGANEEATLSTLKAIRREIVDSWIDEHRGRIFKTMGDGLLVEFASVVDAVNCGIGIQRAMAKRNRGLSFDERIEFRVGVNIGDVIDDAGDLYGDGVNIAARLEAIAESGGICISAQVLEQIDGKVEIACRGLGRKSLKNIAKPVEVFGINLDDEGSAADRFLIHSDLKQEISYCTAADGVRLAFATVGSGRPLLKSAHYLSHLEYDWELPIGREFLRALAKEYSLTRYDSRGNGLSDWNVGEISLDAWVSDMETVVDAAGLERFPLLALSQGVAVAIAYAVRHPDRVSHLVLYGGYAVGNNKNPNLTEADRERLAALRTLVKVGWGSDDPTFRQIFTSLMMPSATKEQAQAFNDLQRLSGSAEVAVRYFDTTANIDVRPLLSKVKTPTLVMHTRDERRMPVALSRDLAAGIPRARFVALPGQDHILVEQHPGLPLFFRELNNFLHAPL
jgi:class 3 adenylate cyclase/pimeloyl-ACP methyl ester carboxylesterase